MNYPIWELTTFGGASLIALISVLHVYIAHLAVGGGIFIWRMDLKGFRESDPDIHAYVRKHTWFFLLLTMVFGGISGVGIWFIIGLVHPAATSALIHSFVFGWAIEWVFFTGEIVALLVYHYRFDRLDRKARLNVAFLYALFAWLSLFIINGILSFMLTPGTWLETRGFWDGFFNPTFFPSLFFRTFAAVMIAGLFGYVTTVFLKDSAFRTRMMRTCTRWLLFPAVGLIPSAFWYYYAVPSDVREVAFGINPEPIFYANVLLVSSVLIFIFGLALARRTTPAVQRGLTFVLIPIGLTWMGGFEYTRELARKPFVINGFMYSTSILKSDVDTLNREGVLTHARWVSVHEVTRENRMQAGRELFNIQCLSCHTVGGIRNDILPLTEAYTQLGVISLLTGQGKMSAYMPGFVGTEAEKEALAAYIVEGLHGKAGEKSAPHRVEPRKQEIPPFDREKGEYILLAWNDLGMHTLSDSDPWFVLSPPSNTLEAQLIRRGETPELIVEGVEISYRVQEGFENPAAHVPFWEQSESNFGRRLERNVGLSGKGLAGKMDPNDETMSFIARQIPVVPYGDDGTYNPYPLFTLAARDVATGKLLARTQAVAPTSTGMGCRNCHGGGWRWNGVSGLSDETAENILKAHDRISGTGLLPLAREGKPGLCQRCHADPALDAKGDPALRNLSAAMHGFHANYMPRSVENPCVLCHPADPGGQTRHFRGIHAALGMACADCHGTLDEHALSLLRGEEEKRGTARLAENLRPTAVEKVADIRPRTPWLNEPDCLACHVDFERPEAGAGSFNRWTEDPEQLYRTGAGNAGIRCPACHGSPHALYPATNPYGAGRDNIQPMQYSGMPYPVGSNISCPVCHRQEMEDPVHHENMFRMFRNAASAK